NRDFGRTAKKLQTPRSCSGGNRPDAADTKIRYVRSLIGSATGEQQEDSKMSPISAFRSSLQDWRMLGGVRELTAKGQSQRSLSHGRDSPRPGEGASCGSALRR